MKAITSIALFAVLLPIACYAQSPAPAGLDQAPQVKSTPVGVAPQSDSSPAQGRVDAAKLQTKAHPKSVQAFNDLATADLRLARETARPSYYKDAEQALTQGLSVDPGDFQLQKTQVALMLARHEFTQAKEKATLLNKKMPDDVMTYGYLAEADIALGDYAEAEQSTQWMLNLLRNNVPGLMLGARLRMLYGDPEGALEFLGQAYSETSPAEVEDLAWIANQMASIQIESGKSDAAVQTLEEAERVFPHYPYTVENLARVRLAQHRPNDAVTLLLKASRLNHDPHVLYQLAKAQNAAGQSKEAGSTYAEFQAAAATQSIRFPDTDRDLVMMYSESPDTAAQALTLAQRNVEQRHDVWTLDAFAWALYANGKFLDADTAIQKAVSVGIQSAEIFNHAGHIAQKLNRAADATKYFELSMRANPSPEYASDSRRLLGLLIEPAEKAMGPPTSQNSGPPNTASLVATAAPLISPTRENVDATIADVAAGPPAFSPVPQALLTPHATDTDRLIHNAQAKVAMNSKEAAGYATLGAAYFQRARETGDVNDYQLAEQSLTKSLDLDSADFSADAPLQTMAEVCMGEHRFDDALDYSQKALSLGSGDISSFAIVGDADADKGEYEKAAADYARLDTTSSPRAAYARDSRVAYLKFIAGDTNGAVRLMKSAVAEGLEARLPNENLAWLYYELGEFSTQAGDASAADAAYLAALTVHPGDYRALAGLARLRSNLGKYAEAIVLYQRAIAVVPMPIFVAELGDLYAKTGDMADAKKQYQLVEYIGLLGHINQVLHNRDLAIFYADHDIKLTEALELAHKEFEVRHDVYTWDALAWALYKNGKYDEAAKASEKALQFGTQDSLLLYHAGMIAEKSGRRDQARNELKEALIINPHFHIIYVDAAQQQLTLFETQASSSGLNSDNYAH